jgi:hypothetical protein
MSARPPSCVSHLAEQPRLLCARSPYKLSIFLSLWSLVCPFCVSELLWPLETLVVPLCAELPLQSVDGSKQNQQAADVSIVAHFSSTGFDGSPAVALGQQMAAEAQHVQLAVAVGAAGV